MYEDKKMEEYAVFLEGLSSKVDNDLSPWADETSHKYEKAISSFITENKDNANFVRFLKDILNDQDAVAKLRYAAYCTLHTYYRRMHQFTILKQLNDERYFCKRLER